MRQPLTRFCKPPKEANMHNPVQAKRDSGIMNARAFRASFCPHHEKPPLPRAKTLNRFVASPAVYSQSLCFIEGYSHWTPTEFRRKYFVLPPSRASLARGYPHLTPTAIFCRTVPCARTHGYKRITATRFLSCRHSALDAESYKNRGLRGKPAMTFF